MLFIEALLLVSVWVWGHVFWLRNHACLSFDLCPYIVVSQERRTYTPQKKDHIALA